jgi:hypothetical protein
VTWETAAAAVLALVAWTPDAAARQDEEHVA